MSETTTTTSTVVRGCFPLGSILAVTLSAALNHSFWWGLLHFFCGWLYVLYVLLVRSKEIVPALRSMFGL